MAQNLQTFTWNDWSKGIDFYDTGAPGTIYFSHGIDFDAMPGYFRPSQKMVVSLSPTEISAMTSAVVDFEAYVLSLYAITRSGTLFRNTSVGLGGSWLNNSAWPHYPASGGAGGCLRMFNDELFWTGPTTVGRVQSPSAGTPTFTDVWQSGLTNSGATHQMKVFVGKLMIGHGRYVATWDTTNWTLQALTLPAGTTIDTMEVFNDYLVMGCRVSNSTPTPEHRLFFWDGTSTTYNSEIKLAGQVQPLCLLSFEGNLWVLSSYGDLYIFDGSNLKEVVKLSNSPAALTVHANCLTGFNSKIYFGISQTQLDLSSDDRTLPGVWSYNTKTGALLFESLDPNLTYDSTSNYINIRSLFNNGQYLFVGFDDPATGTGVSARGIGYIPNVNASTVRDTGSFVITPWFDAAALTKKHFRKFYINCREFPASGSTNEIVVKYRLDDSIRGLGPYTITSASSNLVYVATPADTSVFNVGDEITFTQGPSSGEIRRITAISGNRLTLDATASSVASTTQYIVEPWVELGTITSSADGGSTSKSFNFPNAAVGKKIQFKLELKQADIDEPVAISDLSFTFIPKKPI